MFVTSNSTLALHLSLLTRVCFCWERIQGKNWKRIREWEEGNKIEMSEKYKETGNVVTMKTRVTRICQRLALNQNGSSILWYMLTYHGLDIHMLVTWHSCKNATWHSCKHGTCWSCVSPSEVATFHNIWSDENSSGYTFSLKRTWVKNSITSFRLWYMFVIVLAFIMSNLGPMFQIQ